MTEIELARAYVKTLPRLLNRASRSKKTIATVRGRILDILGKFPSLSTRQISDLLKCTRQHVERLRIRNWREQLIRAGFDRNDIISIENYVSDESFQSELRTKYPGRFYEDHPAARFEERGAISVAVDNGTAHYKVDQAHTIPRPITLASVPYKLSA